MFVDDPTRGFVLPTHSTINPFEDMKSGMMFSDSAMGSSLFDSASLSLAPAAAGSSRNPLASLAAAAAASSVRAASTSAAAGAAFNKDAKNNSSNNSINKKKGRGATGKRKKQQSGRWGSVMSRWAVLGPSKASSLDEAAGKSFNRSEQGDLEYQFLFVETAKKPTEQIGAAAALVQARASRSAMEKMVALQGGYTASAAASSAPEHVASAFSFKRRGTGPTPPSADPTVTATTAAAMKSTTGRTIGGGGASRSHVVSFVPQASGSLFNDGAAAESVLNSSTSSTSAGAKRGFRALRIASKTISALASSHDYNWGTRFGAMPHHNFAVFFDAQTSEAAAAAFRPSVSQWVVDVHRALDRPFFLWLQNWDEVDSAFSQIAGCSLHSGGSSSSSIDNKGSSVAAAASPLFFPTTAAVPAPPVTTAGISTTVGEKSRVRFAFDGGDNGHKSTADAEADFVMSQSKLLHHATEAGFGSSSSSLSFGSNSFFGSGGLNNSNIYSSNNSNATSSFSPHHLPIQHAQRELENLGTVFAPTIDNFTYPHRTVSVDPHSTEHFSLFRPAVRRFTGELQLGEQRSHLTCPTMQLVMQTTWLCSEIQRSAANQRLLDVVFCKHERTLGRVVARVFFAALEGDRSLLLGLAQFKRFARKAKVGSNVSEPWATYGVLSREEEANRREEEQAELRMHKSGTFGASHADLSSKKSTPTLPQPDAATNEGRQSPPFGPSAAYTQAQQGGESDNDQQQGHNGVLALLPILYSQLCKPYSGLSIASFTLALFFLSEMIYRPAEQHSSNSDDDNDDDDDDGDGQSSTSSSSSGGGDLFGRKVSFKVFDNAPHKEETGVFEHSATSGNKSNSKTKKNKKKAKNASDAIHEALRYPDSTPDHEILCDTFVIFVRNHLLPYLDTCFPWYEDPDVSVVTSLPRVHTLVEREYSTILRQMFLLSSQAPVESSTHHAYQKTTTAASKSSSSSSSCAAAAVTASSKWASELATNVVDEEAVRAEDKQILSGTGGAAAGSVAAANEAADLENRVLSGVTLQRLVQTLAMTTHIAQRDKGILPAIENLIWAVSLQHASNPGKAAMRENWAHGHACSALVLWESAALRTAQVDNGDASRAQNFSLVDYFKRNADEGKETRPVAVADYTEPLDSITICYDGFVEALCRVAILTELGRENALRFPTQTQVEGAILGFMRRKVLVISRDIFGANAEPRDDVRSVAAYDRKDGLPVVHTVRLVARASLLREGPSIVNFHQVDLDAPLFACVHRALSVAVKPMPGAASGRAGTFVVPPLKRVLRCIAQNGDRYSHGPHTVTFRVSGRLISQSSIAVRISYLHIFEISFGTFGHRWVAAPPQAVKESSERSPPFTFVTPAAMFQKEEGIVFSKARDLIAASPPGAAKAIVRFARSLVCSARRCATTFIEMAVGLQQQSSTSSAGATSGFDNYCDALDRNEASVAGLGMPHFPRGPRVEETGFDLAQLLLGWSMVEKRALAGGAQDEQHFSIDGLSAEASTVLFGGDQVAAQKTAAAGGESKNRRRRGSSFAGGEQNRNSCGGGGGGGGGDDDPDMASLQQQNTFSLLRRHSLNAESLSGLKKQEKLATMTEALDMLVGGEAAKSYDWLLLMRKSRCAVPPMDDKDDDYLDSVPSTRIEGAKSVEEFAAEFIQDVLLTDAAWVSRYETKTRHKMGLKPAMQQVHHQQGEIQQRARRNSVARRVSMSEASPSPQAASVIAPRPPPPPPPSSSARTNSMNPATASSPIARPSSSSKMPAVAVAPSFEHRTRFLHNSLFTSPTRLTIAFVAQVLRSACSAYRVQRMRGGGSTIFGGRTGGAAVSVLASLRPSSKLSFSGEAGGGGGVVAVRSPQSPSARGGGATAASRPSTASPPLCRAASSSGLLRPSSTVSKGIDDVSLEAVVDKFSFGARVQRTYFDRSLLLGMLTTAVSTQRPGWSYLLVSRQRVLAAVGMGENGTTLALGDPPVRIYGFDEVDRTSNRNQQQQQQQLHPQSSSRAAPFVWTRSFVENGDAEIRRVLEVASRRISDVGADRTAFILSDFVKTSAKSGSKIQLVGCSSFHGLVPAQLSARTASLLRAAHVRMNTSEAADTTKHANTCVIYKILLEDKQKSSGFAPSFLFGTIVETNKTAIGSKCLDDGDDVDGRRSISSSISSSSSSPRPTLSGPFSTLSWQLPLFYADHFAMTLYSTVPLTEVIDWYTEFVLEVRTGQKRSSGAAVCPATDERELSVFTVQDAYAPGIVAYSMQMFREHARDRDSSRLREALTKRGFVIVSDVTS